MDCNDLWEVTIVPSQATLSNDTIIPLTRTLSTISERESKRDICLPPDKNEKEKKVYRNTERSKLIFLPSIYEKSSNDYSHCSFKSDKPISSLHGSKKESHDRAKDKINKEDAHSQTYKDMSNSSAAPFIEIAAAYKILDFITDFDSKISLLTNNCCNEFLKTLQYKKYECNSTARNNLREHKFSKALKVDIDREKVVREISYESKPQIDDLLARDQRSNIAQKIQAPQQRFYKHSDIYPVVDTVKYLARSQSMELDEKENELLSKLQERRRYTRPSYTKNERSSVLYSSREDYLQRDAGFWLFDKSEHLPQITLEECHYLPRSRRDNNKENVIFPANISRDSHTVEKIKTDNSYHMEKDSLEDCALSEQKRESNATIFSSSSVENLIHGSLDKKYEINNMDDEDIPRGRRLVSSRPSLDIARRVRAQIAKDKHSGNAKESIGELYTHDSNILVRLSPKTRRKICHLIKTIVSIDKDSIFLHQKHLINNVLNSKKLLQSKSADAVFAHVNKKDNEIINNAGDCIPTKLSDLSEGKNRLPKRQDSFVNICNQDLSKSKNSIKIYHENTIPASADNPTKSIVRQIIYKDALLKDVGNNVINILSIYRKILENSRDMNWENFREFVEVLHPDEKELWRDVCRIINEEVRKVNGDTDDSTEICIEISPINSEEIRKTGKVITCAQEIVFELDMTLKDENFFNKRFAEERLDTYM